MRIGIDIGGSHIATGIVAERGKLLSKETMDIDLTAIMKETNIEDFILETIDREIGILLERCNYSKSDISKIGIACPGNPTKTALRNLANLHIEKFEIAGKLEEKYGCNVKIKNDGKCAGLAEKEYGSLVDYEDCMFLCIGTGVGSAVFLNGKLLDPKENSGFELGHCIIDKDGEKCNCGNNGCFETFASMKRFKARAIKRLGLDENIVAEEVQLYIRHNIEKNDVKELVDEYTTNVAIGLANYINIFEPEAISFGGSFAYYQDIFLPILNEKIKKYVFNKNNKTKLLCAKLMNDAGMIGAIEI